MIEYKDDLDTIKYYLTAFGKISDTEADEYVKAYYEVVLNHLEDIENTHVTHDMFAVELIELNNYFKLV